MSEFGSNNNLMGFVNKFFSVANPMVIDLKSVVNQIADGLQ